MNTLSRLHTIDTVEAMAPRRARAIRVVVSQSADQSRVVLAPGDRLIVENRTGLTLRVVPLDFFGTAFDRHVLETGESTPPLAVSGLWFQVELCANGRRNFPLDVYLAPNGVA